MFKYFFQTAPSMLFEPLAITMLIGFACIFLLCKKKNKVLFLSLTGAVLFMAAWRLSIHSMMHSSRYAQILIYPCVILSACLCMNMRVLFRWIFCKLKLAFPCRKELCKFLPAVLFIGLFFACVGKSLHVDLSGDFIDKITKAYEQHRRNGDLLHVASQEECRIPWYLKRKINEVYVLNIDRNLPTVDNIKKAIETLRNIKGDHYLFFYLKKGETEPSAQTMKFDKNSGTWEILARYYTSRKKKEEILLARYRPVCPNMQEWNGKIPAQPKNNLIPAGDFEKELLGEELKGNIAYYQKFQVKGYLDLSKRKLPAGWWCSFNEWNSANPADIRLTAGSPLAGKYALQIDSRPPLDYAMFGSGFFTVSCNYSMFVRGEGQQFSEIVVEAISRNALTQKYKPVLLGKFFIKPGKVYRLHGEIPCDKFEPGFQNFCLQFTVKGFVSLDQVSLTPLQ